MFFNIVLTLAPLLLSLLLLQSSVATASPAPVPAPQAAGMWAAAIAMLGDDHPASSSSSSSAMPSLSTPPAAPMPPLEPVGFIPEGGKKPVVLQLPNSTTSG